MFGSKNFDSYKITLKMCLSKIRLNTEKMCISDRFEKQKVGTKLEMRNRSAAIINYPTGGINRYSTY